MDDQKLQIVISAVDNASQVLKSMAENVGVATGSVSESNEKAGVSFTELNQGIELAEKAYHTVVDAIEPFIEAALKQSETMAQVRVNVNNAGLSYAALAPQMDAVARANVRLGFTDDDTQMSLSKAILATGNYNDALKLNQLAMDLAVAKGMDLNSATVLLQQAMAGNTRVLKQYGISIDSTASSADVLNTIQEKVGGSAEALAGSPAGKVREFQAQWDQVKEEIGDKLLPVVEEFITVLEDSLPAIVKLLGGVADGINGIVKTAKDIGTVLGGDLPAGAITAKEATAAMNEEFNKLSAAYDKLHPHAGIVGKDLMENNELLKEAAKDYTQLNPSVKNAADTFDSFGNRIHAADSEVEKHSTAVAALKKEYDKMSSSGSTDLATLADDFKTKMESINSSIASTQKSIKDLTNSFNQTQTDNTNSVADSIVASEEKIADLKKQLSKATTQSQIDDLNAQLATEQANYDSSLAFRIANATEITIAEAKAKETDLQRTIEDYNAKKLLDATAYQEKLETLNKELADKQKEATDETTLYQNKVTAINKVLKDANAYFIKLSNDRKETTTAEVDAEIKEFQALAAAISQMKSASASALGTIQTQGLGLSSHAAGGFVNAPTGTAVPIIAHGGEEIIPSQYAGKRGSSDGIVVNIINPSVRNDSDLTEIARQVENYMRPLLLNTKIVHI